MSMPAMSHQLYKFEVSWLLNHS